MDNHKSRKYKLLKPEEFKDFIELSPIIVFLTSIIFSEISDETLVKLNQIIL